MKEHADTLLGMSHVTRPGWRYRPNRSVLLPVRLTPTEREALRAAAKWENMTVSGFVRAAIAVRARDGYCQRHGSTEPSA